MGWHIIRDHKTNSKKKERKKKKKKKKKRKFKMAWSSIRALCGCSDGSGGSSSNNNNNNNNNNNIRTLCTTPTPVYAGREHTVLNMLWSGRTCKNVPAHHTHFLRYYQNLNQNNQESSRNVSGARISRRRLERHACAADIALFYLNVHCKTIFSPFGQTE